jgi:hypothetical protein
VSVYAVPVAGVVVRTVAEPVNYVKVRSVESWIDMPENELEGLVSGGLFTPLIVKSNGVPEAKTPPEKVSVAVIVEPELVQDTAVTDVPVEQVIDDAREHSTGSVKMILSLLI